RRPRARAPAARRGEGSVSAVLAVPEARDRALRKVSFEVVTVSRRLADALGDGQVHALALGAGPLGGAERMSTFGADRVTTLTNAAFERYAPEGYAAAIVDRVTAGGY